ncbi:hypothetical protein VTL71DRAFT_11205 [Oculimacula yallundae]|uniref:SprT-like domain-containing protein n=1 Tax=Oculimacula yallundae TaxID=86028 RepID=A0ABR4CXU4_9HELO
MARRKGNHGKGKSSRKGSSKAHRGESAKHPQITDRLQNPSGKIYKQKELSFALQVNANRLYAEVQDRLSHADIAILRGDIPDVTSKTDLTRLLNIWLRILDKALFFNLIRRGIRKQDPLVVYEKVDDMHGACWSMGKRTYITLNRLPEYNQHGSIAQCFIGTLAHEMLHAFFHLYSCESCSHCKKRMGARKGGEGKLGHGPTWCNAIVKIQKALQLQLGWEVNTYHARSIAIEMRNSGWVPRDDQIERWELTEFDLEAMAEDEEDDEDNEWEDDEQQLFCLCTTM